MAQSSKKQGADLKGASLFSLTNMEGIDSVCVSKVLGELSVKAPQPSDGGCSLFSIDSSGPMETQMPWPAGPEPPQRQHYQVLFVRVNFEASHDLKNMTRQTLRFL